MKGFFGTMLWASGGLVMAACVSWNLFLMLAWTIVGFARLFRGQSLPDIQGVTSSIATAVIPFLLGLYLYRRGKRLRGRFTLLSTGSAVLSNPNVAGKVKNIQDAYNRLAAARALDPHVLTRSQRDWLLRYFILFGILAVLSRLPPLVLFIIGPLVLAVAAPSWDLPFIVIPLSLILIPLVFGLAPFIFIYSLATLVAWFIVRIFVPKPYTIFLSVLVAAFGFSIVSLVCGVDLTWLFGLNPR